MHTKHRNTEDNVLAFSEKKIVCAAYRYLTVGETDDMSLVKAKAGVKLNMENISHHFLLI